MADKKGACVTWYPSVTGLGFHVVMQWLYKEAEQVSVIVITGAAGLIGSMLLRPRLARPDRTLRLRRDDHAVRSTYQYAAQPLKTSSVADPSTGRTLPDVAPDDIYPG
jgi:hypothetical protein